jgi:hypothetical protein
MSPFLVRMGCPTPEYRVALGVITHVAKNNTATPV